MPSYKLTYFDGKARAEPIRYMMELQGITYEDNRIQREKWPEVKPSKLMVLFCHVGFVLPHILQQ